MKKKIKNWLKYNISNPSDKLELVFKLVNINESTPHLVAFKAIDELGLTQTLKVYQIIKSK